MVYENQQKYANGGTDGTGSCTTSGDRIRSHQKSPQVYAATIAGVPDYQRTSRPRLSQYPRHAQRMVGPASSPRFTSRSTFYNALCCQQTIITKADCRNLVAFDLAAMSQSWTSKSPLKTGCDRLDRDGNTPCIALLYTSLQTPRRALQTKLSAICDTSNHLILGIVIDRGPKLDYAEDESTLLNALLQQTFDTLVADAGYESERFHKLCREELNIESIIPTTQRGRPRQDGKSKAVTGHYRKLMQNDFPKNIYGQRWQVETVFSMLKRNLGCAVRARNYYSQTREIRLRVLTHNLMILKRTTYVLYRARLSAINNV